MGERSPSYQSYPKDWRDVKVRRMSLAAQGAYRALCDDMWADSKDQCSLLDCDPFLAKSLGVSVKKWRALRKEIQHETEPLFIEKDGRLYSKRLKAEAMKQRKYAKSQSERAHKRWEKQVDAAAMPRHSPGSTKGHAKSCSSSSSSSSLKRVKIKRKSETHAMPDHWMLSEENRKYAMAKGMTTRTIDHEFEHCKVHHEKEETKATQKGWESQVWRTWVLNWISFGRKQIEGPVPVPRGFKALPIVQHEGEPCPPEAVAQIRKILPEFGA